MYFRQSPIQICQKMSKVGLRDPTLDVTAQDHATYPSTFLTHLYISKCSHCQSNMSHGNLSLPYLQSTQGQRYRNRGCFSGKVKVMAPHVHLSLELMLNLSSSKWWFQVQLPSTYCARLYSCRLPDRYAELQMFSMTLLYRPTSRVFRMAANV